MADPKFPGKLPVKVSYGRWAFLVKKEIEQFANWWAAENRGDNQAYPTAMRDEDWWEHFQLWLASKEMDDERG